MKPDEVKKVTHGIYEIFWDDDGPTSYAAVGSNAKGERWFAPINWTNGMPCYDWSRALRVEKQGVYQLRPELKDSFEEVSSGFKTTVGCKTKVHPSKASLPPTHLADPSFAEKGAE